MTVKNHLNEFAKSFQSFCEFIPMIFSNDRDDFFPLIFKINIHSDVLVWGKTFDGIFRA
jgi:hypothetical protein